ncbi:MAG: DUF5716 family protein [Lachnospiraceae bacterium]|nr:DUF5716 family protein [Lachnospiraceae bacterium]
MEVNNVMIGIDLNRDGSQLCFYDRAGEEAVSVPVRAGSEQLTFPTRLCMVPAENAWYYGIEAEYFAERKNGILLDQLYDLWEEGESIRIQEKEYTAAQLLAVFLEKVLGMVKITRPSLEVGCLMLTVPGLTRKFVGTIRQAYEILGLPKNRGCIQDYKESFFVHTMFQSQDVWARKTGLFEFRNGQVQFQEMELKGRTKPVTAYVNNRGRRPLSGNPEQKDQQLLGFIREMLGEDMYSGIFLVGEEFDQSWARESVRTLCKGQRKVFAGSNLFAKGAALSAMEKLEGSHLKGFQYVGSDLVRYTISMELQVQGIVTVYPLIAAGGNWYDTSAEFEIILDQQEELTFLVNRMHEKARKKLVMPLPGLPKRPGRASRLRVCMEYETAGRCRIDVEDLGFGEMFPSSGKIWREIMEEQS